MSRPSSLRVAGISFHLRRAHFLCRRSEERRQMDQSLRDRRTHAISLLRLLELPVVLIDPCRLPLAVVVVDLECDRILHCLAPFVFSSLSPRYILTVASATRPHIAQLPYSPAPTYAG